MNEFLQRVKRLFSRFGLGSGKHLALDEYLSLDYDLSLLHLGCGNIHIPGWCNVDAIRTGAADLILDIASLPGIQNDRVDKIYSCHVLEHFAHAEIEGILRRWHKVLRPGGEIRISVPDLDAITRIYQKNINHFQVSGNQPWIALFYGGQKDKYDFHKTGFNFCWLKVLLESSGFVAITRYPHLPHFIPGVVDNSLANKPFGEFISLNVLGKKSL
jgi:predicted SAM-dependent methyltransferase